MSSFGGPNDFFYGPDLVNVYHRSSETSTETKLLKSNASTKLLGEESPYLRSLIDAARRSADNCQPLEISVVGADFTTCRAILRGIEPSLNAGKAILRIGTPELLRYCELHEAASLFEINDLIGRAVGELGMILSPPLHPANVYAVLSRYKSGQYVDAMTENLAETLIKWYGSEYMHCKFATYLREKFPEFWAEVSGMAEKFSLEEKTVAEKQEEGAQECQWGREALESIQQEATTGDNRAFRTQGAKRWSFSPRCPGPANPSGGTPDLGCGCGSRSRCSSGSCRHHKSSMSRHSYRR